MRIHVSFDIAAPTMLAWGVTSELDISISTQCVLSSIKSDATKISKEVSSHLRTNTTYTSFTTKDSTLFTNHVATVVLFCSI